MASEVPPELNGTGLSERFTLDLFGLFAMRDSQGEPVRGLSRKARGLIAYLVIGRPSASRDELASLLWGDREVEQARASLRQTCHKMRQAFPETAIPLLAVGREKIELDRKQILSDIETLAEDANDPHGMTKLLDPARRSLLSDLSHLSPKFDIWIRVERVRLAGERRAACLRAARAASDACRWADARQIAAALLNYNSTDDEASEIAVRAAKEIGDQNLRSALDTRSHDFLVENRAACVEPNERKPALPFWAASWNPSALRESPLTGSRKLSRRWLAVAAVITIATTAGLQLRGAENSNSADTLVRIDALEAPHGDDEALAVSGGLRAAVARSLVGSETPVQITGAEDASGIPPALIVRGNTMNDHGLLRANIEFVSGRSGGVIWAWQISRPIAELDQFEDQIGLQIARELHFAYTSGRGRYFDRDAEFARLSLAHTDTLARNGDEAVRFAAQITGRAPEFARGWAEYATDLVLASEYLPMPLRLAANARARSYAWRALRLNPHEGLAYGALMLTLDTAPQWIERDKVALRGMAAAPNEPMIHCFRYDSLSGVGRLRDALVEAKLSFQHEHFLPGPLIKQIEGEALVGDLAKARDDLALAQRFWPHHPWFEGMALELELTKGDPLEALKLLDAREARNREYRSPSLRAYLKWRASPSSASKAQAERQIENVPNDDGSIDKVQLLVMLGDLDEAYRMAKEVPTSSYLENSWFSVALAPFRADPRFMTFAARLGIAQIWQQTGEWPDFCSDRGLKYDCKTAARAALLSQARDHTS